MPFALGTDMFRITKAFENHSTFIYRIEGKITDNTLGVWGAELDRFKTHAGRQIILDFCQVLFISPRALQVLLTKITPDFYILNCGMEIRNFLHASGLAARMLE